MFWELEGQDALSVSGSSLGKVERPWLENTFERIGEVISEAVKAGVECGSFGLQLMPNAFEVSGSFMECRGINSKADFETPFWLDVRRRPSSLSI